MAILTNRGTADAAEILAAAVMDNKRGQVVGERTYGDAARAQGDHHGRRRGDHPVGGEVLLARRRQGDPGHRRDARNRGQPKPRPGGVDDNGEPLPEQQGQGRRRKWKTMPW